MKFRRSLFKKRIKGQGSAARRESRARVFSHRAAVLAGGQLALFGLLIGRLYQLQVVDRERHATLAEDNRIASQIMAPPRGRIVDRLGVALRGMDGVVNGEQGTARRVRLPEHGVAMAGKTSTSQVRRITRQERAAGVPRPEKVEWRYRDHALFVCFAPVDRPRFAVSVIVEHGGGGSAVAAPIAQEIMIEALRRASQQLMLSQAGDCSHATRTVRGS